MRSAAYRKPEIIHAEGRALTSSISTVRPDLWPSSRSAIFEGRDEKLSRLIRIDPAAANRGRERLRFSVSSVLIT